MALVAVAAAAHTPSSHRLAFDRLPKTLKDFLIRYPPTQLYKEKYPTDPRWSFPSQPSPDFDPDRTPYKSPFEPSRSLGRWRGPRIGLMQQAKLFKTAREHGCEALLPLSDKRSDVKEQKRLKREEFLASAEGQRVKGHRYERQMTVLSQKRKRAMLDMPRLVEEWRNTGHGRGWKKWPK